MKPGLKKALIQRGLPKKQKQIKAKELADLLGMTADNSIILVIKEKAK